MPTLTGGHRREPTRAPGFHVTSVILKEDEGVWLTPTTMNITSNISRKKERTQRTAREVCLILRS